jgi:hypothetical protein
MPRSVRLAGWVLTAAVGALMACSKSVAPPPAAESAAAARPAHAEPAIDWVNGDPAAVDAAFARAREARQPLFLYWGAVWCPPCNEVKATVFKRRDFAERARFFIPVYIDGDSAGAQKLGARFKVSAYPTMILFSPDGTEITRLPGEVDAARYMQMLALGMNAGRPAKSSLAAALARGGDATADDWRMLAYYSWDTDDGQLVPAGRLPSTLQRLAANCPAALADLGARLALRSLAAAALAKPVPAVDRSAAQQRVMAVLADDAQVRENFDLVTAYPAEIVGLISAPKSDARARLAAAWDRALARLVDDATLARTDRLVAVIGRVQLARLQLTAASALLPETLQQQVIEETGAADRAASDAYERQAVISVAADALTEAGLVDRSDALLKAELPRSASPYYLMLGLAANAARRGDKAAALDWYRQAFEAAQGRATRLQWGARYVRALIELAPQDEARIDGALGDVLGELAPEPETFYGRNRAVLDHIMRQVRAWNKNRRHDAVVRHARARVLEICSRLPAATPEASACRSTLAPAA